MSIILLVVVVVIGLYIQITHNISINRAISSSFRKGCGDNNCYREEIGKCNIDCSTFCPKDSYCNTAKCLPSGCTEGGWLSEYRADMIKNNISFDLTKNDLIYNYENERIKLAMTEIGDVGSAEEAAKKVAKYVYENIEYTSDVTYGDCYNKDAAMILYERKGTCSTQSKLNIAMLRAFGLAARPVTGCLMITPTCSALSFFGLASKIPVFDEILIDNEGYAVARGGLHTWAEVWIPEAGWVKLEPTAGVLINEQCVGYLPYRISPDETELCGLKSSNPFVMKCNEYI